ncbi:glucose dehydrogenase [FAD, quinone] [Bicyclus anynana]|uniref:Glucose dehydrogenase [FAD, quinone] n=1 Tax=Bicyclus anynana TaxID=110368 RepID=A0A6J1N322_BICAN|nr:glucose dehydrogenase [FAD, quinone] [Bicyclus anynana]
MATTWTPPELSEICYEQHAPLSQCSPMGVMFLALVTRLFGGVSYSVPYSKTNPYDIYNDRLLNPGLYSSDVSGSDYDFPIGLFKPNFDIRSPYSQHHIAPPRSKSGYHINIVSYHPPPPYTHYDSKFESHEPIRKFDFLENNFGDLGLEETKAVPTVVTKSEKKKKSRRKRETAEYDFIIVGAGSAGCVIANRLSEVKKWKILLLEAGPEQPDVTMVPSFAPTLKGSNIDWNFRTQPEELTCRSARGQSCSWTSGRTMGGSSSVNYLVYSRGNRLDYDTWAGLGNYGWSYSEVLPYFKKSENNRDVEASDKHYHAVGGPLNVERYPYTDINTIMLVDAFKEKGIPLKDLTAPDNLGTGISLSTSKDGRRWSSNVAFIKPIREHRPNLDILVEARATKIIIDPDTKVAHGITYFKNGKFYSAYARKEVIVSSGTINSPKLLMLSGVGPKEHLESLHIPVLSDLRVGHNLQDHVTTDALIIALSNKTSTAVNSQELLDEVQLYDKQEPKKDGPLSTTSTLNSIAFIKTKYAYEPAPDIQYHFDARNVREFYSDPTTYVASSIFPLAFYDGLSVRPLLLTPKSRGLVLLNETDPIFSNPLIFPRFFTNKLDLDVLIEGMRYVTDLEETEVFKHNGASFVKEPVKGCEAYLWGTYEYFACILIEYTSTIYHPVGTCKMGPSWDKEAVIDPRLRVYGIKNLRVIDASVMPTIIRGNTNAPTMMIAEKATDMIKEDWLSHKY